MQKLIPKTKNANMDGLKMVKGAYMFLEDQVYFIRHYDTIIFANDPLKQRCEVNWNCSRTSNNQIMYALNFFGIDRESAIDVSDGSKWAYSRQMY